uniref:contactin-3-like n=1 Tax=Myxine glutinosa TaxID=7769 RepID=UPI003590201E
MSSSQLLFNLRPGQVFVKIWANFFFFLDDTHTRKWEWVGPFIMNGMNEQLLGHAESNMSLDPDIKGHLIINSVQLRHAGNYTCTVRSTVDTVSASAELRVKGPPEPPTDLQIHDVTDATAVLSWVPGHDNHSPITQFLAQARASLFLDWTEQKTDPSPIVGEMDMAMVVGLTPWTDYEFRLIAINALGHSKSSPPSRRTRTLSAAPKIYPEGLGGGKGKRHELVITWKPIERKFRHGPDFGYIIAFRMNGSHTFRQVTIPLPDAPRYTYKNTSLASFTPFEVKIRAYNVEAEGPFSPSIIVFSAEQEPNIAPANVFAKSLTSSTVEVTWELISPNAITERIQGYQVVYSQQRDPKASLRYERVPLGENRVRLTGLRSATTYHITVQAFNTAGVGPSSPMATIITRKGPPSKSPRLAQWWLDGSTVSLYWEQVVPMANESAVTGYKVLYRAMGQTSPHELLTNGTSAELALTGATSYVIEVRAQSVMGDGPSLQLQVPNDSSRGMKFGGPLGSACRPFTWNAVLLALLSVFVCYVRLV